LGCFVDADKEFECGMRRRRRKVSRERRNRDIAMLVMMGGYDEL